MPNLDEANSQLNATARAIASLELQKADLLDQVKNVDVQLKYARAKHGKLLNQNSAIQKLPCELLSSIFMTCQQFPRTNGGNVPFEVLASHVSTIWREVSLGTHLLWTNVTVRVRPRQLVTRMTLQWTLDRVETYLARSGTCLFTTSLDISGPFEIDEILGAIGKHASRWRRLNISIRNPPAAAFEIWQALRSLSVPELEQLSITLAKLSSDGYNPSDDRMPFIFKGGSPSLKSVRLSGVAIGSLIPPLEMIETLDLSRHPLSYDVLRALFDGMPNLINLSLGRIDCPYRQASVTPILLDKLLALRLYGNIDDESVHPHHVLRMLSVPALETLVLKDFEAFEEHVFPNVHTVTLLASPLSAGDMLRMIRAFPSLQNFRLDESLPDIFDLLGMLDTATHLPPWPRLETLTVTDMEIADVGLLCDMISQRQLLKAPLARLELDRRSRVVLRKKCKLEWLRTVAHVVSHEGAYPWPSDTSVEDQDDGFWDP